MNNKLTTKEIIVCIACAAFIGFCMTMALAKELAL